MDVDVDMDDVDDVETTEGVTFILRCLIPPYSLISVQFAPY